ncbi:MAG: L,D-transpeptidase family protein [Woeseiaceae bacterium]
MLLTRLVLLLWLTGPLAAAAGLEQRLQSPASDGVLGTQYLGLAAELQRYRSISAAGGWPTIPAGPTLRPGAEDPRLGDLAERLAITGDLPADETGHSHYDEALENAVRRFQGRHGLAMDGLVGRATLRALNVSAQKRVDQIRVNLERMRALADAGEPSLLLVNIAAFEATLYRDAAAAWSTRVIVGEQEAQTPELTSEVRSVVFNPTWWVPRSIASEEMLPKIRQDPGFLAKGGYELYDRDRKPVDPDAVDWGDYSVNNFPFQIMQRPGPDNQLGQVKFVFSNPYSLCIHDTPSRSLFANTRRALSHGCVRIDEPMALATLLLEAEGWTKTQVVKEAEAGVTKSVVLSQPLPLFIVYWTAMVDEVGTVQFYDDIYDRDAQLLKRIRTDAR